MFMMLQCVMMKDLNKKWFGFRKQMLRKPHYCSFHESLMFLNHSIYSVFAAYTIANEWIVRNTLYAVSINIINRQRYNVCLYSDNNKTLT